MSLIAKKEASDSVTEKAEFDSAMKVVTTCISKLESSIKRGSIDVGEECYKNNKQEMIKAAIDPSILSVVQSEFQADSTLAGAINSNDADILLSTDSDLAALLGRRCISIKSFVYQNRYKVKVLKELDIFSAEYQTMQDIAQHLNMPVDSIVLAKRPVFEGIPDIKTRCLISVGLGCDVCIGGVPNITPKTMHEFLCKLMVEGCNVDEYFEKIMAKYLTCYKSVLLKKSWHGRNRSRL
jgi:hypothetical protein